MRLVMQWNMQLVYIYCHLSRRLEDTAHGGLATPTAERPPQNSMSRIRLLCPNHDDVWYCLLDSHQIVELCPSGN